MNAWFYLGIAIVSEVAATSALKASEGFTHSITHNSNCIN